MERERASVVEVARLSSQHEFILAESIMQFDTKIAVVIRTDLEAWQKLNVASFLAGGMAAAFPECIGEPYEDGSGTRYLSLIGQPILIYGADRPGLTRALERALARFVRLGRTPRREKADSQPSAVKHLSKRRACEIGAAAADEAFRERIGFPNNDGIWPSQSRARETGPFNCI
jgi:uncharacterized protein DUF2000